MRKCLRLAALVILSGYMAPSQAAPKPKSVSDKEASAFELSLQTGEAQAQEPSKTLFVQPVNKVEACKLPTSQDQLDRPNFRAYWDGECRNGFAFGLGRDIAISDTHHIEEITIHDGSGDNWSRPKVDFDYVANTIVYAVGGPAFPIGVSLGEKMDNAVSGFDAFQTLRVIDESMTEYLVVSSAFHSQRIYMKTIANGSLTYKFVDNSATPAINPTDVSFMAEVMNRKRTTKDGLTIIRYANGAVRHVKVINGVADNIRLSDNYAGQIQSKYQDILNRSASAYTGLQRAQQIEKEYLFKACNGKSGVKGLDNAEYTRICTWRDQFKQPYAMASAAYQRKLESLRQQAATAEQQRQIQQQILLQQQMMQQQQSQQAWNEQNQANQQLQQRTQQILQGVTSQQAPLVQPITPPGGNRIVCNTIGSITSCR